MAEDFFGDLSKSLSSAAQQAASKTSTFIETQKKTVQIATAQREIEKIYQRIGEKIVEESKREGAAPVSEEIQALLDEIVAQNIKIEDLKQGIAKIRGQKICTCCGFTMDIDALFCPQCGTKAPEVVEEPVKEEAVEAEDVTDADVVDAAEASEDAEVSDDVKEEGEKAE